MAASQPPKHLRIAFTIFPEALSLDFIGPLDVLSFLREGSPTRPESPSAADVPTVECIVIGDSKTPMRMSNGMHIVPTMSYDEAEAEGQEWDAVLVPGGVGARPWAETNRRTVEFLKKVVPQCKFVFTVCTGSWLLAAADLLEGQKATCNKRAFKDVLEHTKDKNVTWVPKARWVVSNQFWTSSGITAGIDMAAAFVRYFVGLHVQGEEAKAIADEILGSTEVTGIAEDVDPWADYYGLV